MGSVCSFCIYHKTRFRGEQALCISLEDVIYFSWIMRHFKHAHSDGTPSEHSTTLNIDSMEPGMC